MNRNLTVTALAAALLAGCMSTNSLSQKRHQYDSAKPQQQVADCIKTKFTPRYYGGVEAQGGWPDRPQSMKIDANGAGTEVSTLGPIDRELYVCLE